MNTETKINFLKSIFDGKGDNWINDNIISYSKLTPNDFKLILNAIHANKYPNISEYYRIFFWISYSYFTIPNVKHFIPNIILPINESASSGLVKYYMYHMTPNKIFVSFRGTKTFFEALSGIKFYRVPFPMFQPKQKKNLLNGGIKLSKEKNLTLIKHHWKTT